MDKISWGNSAFLLVQYLLTGRSYMAIRDAKGSYSVPNVPKETNKTQVDSFKTSSKPFWKIMQRLVKCSKNYSSSKTPQVKAVLVIKAMNNNS